MQDKQETPAAAAPKADPPAAADKAGKGDAEVKVEASDNASGLETPKAPGVDTGLDAVPKGAADGGKGAEPDINIEELRAMIEQAKASGELPSGEGTAETAEAAATALENFSRGGIVFGLGLGLLVLFVWYFASESSLRKRLIGSFLAIAVTGMSLWFYKEQGLQEGIEIQGGVSMDIRIVPDEGKEITPSTQEQVIKVLTGRLSSLVAESDMVLAPQGKDMIFLQIPGVGPDRVAEIKKALEKVAKLEFSILHPQSNSLAAAVAADSEVVTGHEALPFVKKEDKDGNPLPPRWGLVRIQKDLTGDAIASAKPMFGQEGWEISVKFTGDGASVMGPLTLKHQNEPLAIILDSEILSAPNILNPFSTGCQITGDFSQQEAADLASALENPLKNPIRVEYANYISPTMGKATVQQGISAGIAGLGITLLFILLYYRFAGLIAMIGMGIAITIIFGMMALFKFTLTLPGMAGIILTIGIAIDANVLIYERLREEMKSGKSIGSAIKTAYEKAFSAIFDANITTLITAIILFQFAAGTVKGFAITLMIGILATLFSALLVTRVCFNWGTESGFVKKLGFMNLVPDKLIDFLGRRKIALIGSSILVATSLIVVPTLDPRGVELKGGDAITLQSEEGLTKQSIESTLDRAEFLEKTPIVQVQQPVGGEGEFFLIRADFGKAEQILEFLKTELDVGLDGAQTSSVGSAVGKTMLGKSALALGIGLIAILLYVTFRFEFAFALGAIAA
ncbi:MAG: protein translocase subunit SecD, partial [Verrucomicrobiales bacterium]|nr:protein translocase subunit SecD [Verrucomicrobiales bacterium]